MVAMTSLFRHAKTGMYWVRRKVPKDLRSIIGKGEIQRTTKTKDKAEAKVRAKPIGIEIDRIFADARAGKFRKFSDSELTTSASAAGVGPSDPPAARSAPPVCR